MGGKPTRRGNAVYLCFAFLMFLGPLACSIQTGARITDVTGDEARRHLAQGRKLFHEGNFENALLEVREVSTLAGADVPVAESLFYIGLIHAHPANPAVNYGDSLIFFNKLVRDHPESPFSDQAKAIARLIQENVVLRETVKKLNGEAGRLTGEVERLTTDAGRLSGQMDRMTGELGRLNRLIDELKKVDIDVEQKRREQGKK